MSKRSRGDLQLILPKEGSSTASLPKEDSSEVTKVIDLQIEDFLAKMNQATQEQISDCVNFINSPGFLIGHQEVSVGCWFNEEDEDEDNNSVMLGVENVNSDHLRSMSVTGNCGNLAVEKRDYAKGVEFLSVELGSVEELREAMTTTGNHKLDLQMTLTALVTGDSCGDQWIIPR